MTARWCISILVFSLTLFGAISQHQMVTPNQEIVLQFQDVGLTLKQTESTAHIVKQQLHALGAKNIQVLSFKNGRLKISYFSKTDIASIKQTFSKESEVALQISSESKNKKTSNFPFEEADVSYNLNVYEIQHGQNGWDFDGAISFNTEPKTDRFIDPNYLAIECIGFKYQECIYQLAYKIRKQGSILLSDPLHIIPEVRAGPIC
ncbi:hypothetical protein [Algibacter sp. PT7-4]|uniref:hypothetical protein n=1 Tax=Algibacter ulvanivorans TaxID=3400999 RepID=UPI003AAD41A9